MKKGLILLTLALLPAVWVSQSIAAPVENKQQPSAEVKKQGANKEVREFDWGDLMPAPDPKVVEAYQTGKMDRDAVIDYLEALGNTTVPEVDKIYGKMPGFLVPLNLDKNQKATELLLVPTMGACIHVPPPPPNQTIYIKYDKGISVTEAGYTPYWITGTLIVEKNTSEYTDTLYSFKVESIEEYF